MYKQPCPAGYQCPAGTDQYPDLSFQCPVGHYCPEGNSVEVPCEAGTYRNTVGARSEF